MEDSRVCPICDTANPSDALLCEVCGENLIPEENAGEIGDQLSADGVVGFAIEDSEEMEDDIEFGASAASDATMDMGDDAPAFHTDDPDADSTDEEMMMAAPADETAAMESFAEHEHGHIEATDVPEHDSEAGHGEVEATEVGGEVDSFAEDDGEFPDDTPDSEFPADTGEMSIEEATGEAELVEETGAADFDNLDEDFNNDDEAEFDHADEGEFDHVDEGEFDPDHDEAEFDHADEFEADSDGGDDGADDAPEYLYSPVDGTAFPRGSAEYEEGFGPNGEELVATPPDAAFDALEAEIGGEVSGASMDDDELAAAAAPSPTVSAEFKAAFQARPKQRPVMAPLPQPGTYVDPAVLTVYQNRQPVMRLAIDMDEVLIGRRDPVADAYPDLDLSDLDPEAHISRKHAYIYRQNKNYTLYAVSNAGTQLNADLLDLGDRRALNDGDVIVLAGKIAMKFELPNT